MAVAAVAALAAHHADTSNTAVTAVTGHMRQNTGGITGSPLMPLPTSAVACIACNRCLSSIRAAACNLTDRFGLRVYQRSVCQCLCAASGAASHIKAGQGREGQGRAGQGTPQNLHSPDRQTQIGRRGTSLLAPSCHRKSLDQMQVVVEHMGNA